jgi:hypothetical protein
MPADSPSSHRELERHVLRHTGHRVRDLVVEMCPGRVTLRGRAPSYYVKQLAQHALLGLLDGTRLDNVIAVEVAA